MLGAASLLLTTLLALGLPEPGLSLRVEGRLEEGRPWTVDLIPPGAETWVLVELTGDDRADLDLEARIPDALARCSASHRSAERLLLAVPEGAALQLAVSARRKGDPAFSLLISTLRPAAALRQGAPRRSGPLAVRAELVPLTPPTERFCLALAAPGEADLLVLDGGLEPLARCEGPGDERTVLDPSAAPAVAVVLLAPGTPGYTLALETPPELAPTPLDRFLEELGRTPEQRRALEVLRRHPDWVAIRGYLERYPDGAPLELRTIPGLRARGVERFGGYAHGVLAINPTIDGHRDNVQELVDTLVHELVHALLALPRAEGYPLAEGVLDSTHDPALVPLAGRSIRRGNVAEPLASYLEREYGPSASDPHRDWSDINAGAQHLVKKVVEQNLSRTGLGRETLVFENVRRRESAGK